MGQMVMGTALVGLGSTGVIDAWAWLRRRLFGTSAPNYALVGRWLGHMPRGRFRHRAIQAAEPVRGERWIGWSAHYLIGVGFAALLPLIWGVAWLRQPTLVPALVVGIGTVAAPFFAMQPGMGAGIAARHTARPGVARVQSLVTHAVFGLGLYAAGCLVQPLFAT